MKQKVNVVHPVSGVVTTKTKVYGWVKEGRAYLSRFMRSQNGSAQQYATKEDAETAAALRNLAIEWDNG